MRSLSTSIRLASSLEMVKSNIINSSNKFMKNQYFYCKCDIKHISIVYIFYSELHVQNRSILLEFNILIIFFDAINLFDYRPVTAHSDNLGRCRTLQLVVVREPVVFPRSVDCLPQSQVHASGQQ